MEILEEEGITNIQFKRIGIPDKFIEHGSPEVLRKNYGLNAECIAETIWKHFNLSSLQAMHTEVETKTSKVLMVK
jgi:deoxyxylulose-5-phosphate synthase